MNDNHAEVPSRCSSSSPGRGHGVVFLDKILYVHIASLLPGA